MVGVGQSVEKKIPLGGISQPMLRMSREERPNIPPERMGQPNGNDNETSNGNGDSHDHGNSPNKNGGPGGNGDPPDRRGERPLEIMEIQMDEMPLVRALEETSRAQRTNLDTTGLENSFSQFGRTMSEVLKAQQRTNQNLEEQFRRANERQEFQTEAMQDMAQANFQMKFDHMFASVPIYDGTDPDTFDDWLYQIVTL